MFTDARSKRIVLISHCILNQNSISDNTADFPATIEDILRLLLESKVGILQMPCPELLCLGLDRGDIYGGEREVVIENTRIRKNLGKPESREIINRLVNQLIYQIEEYIENGFEILGIIGVNRSPSCGINTTSKNNREVEGQGVFMEELTNVLDEKNISIHMIGIKSSEINKAIEDVKRLIGVI